MRLGRSSSDRYSAQSRLYPKVQDKETQTALSMPHYQCLIYEDHIVKNASTQTTETYSLMDLTTTEDPHPVLLTPTALVSDPAHTLTTTALVSAPSSTPALLTTTALVSDPAPTLSYYC